MTADVAQQLRAMVGAARPVTADEAIVRSERVPGALGGAFHSPPARHRGGIALAGLAVLLAAAGIGWTMGFRPTGHELHPGMAAPSFRPGSVLSVPEIQQITRSTTAAAMAGGTAEVFASRHENGVPKAGYQATVTFAGSSIDEKVTSVPEPAGAAGASSIEDRWVNGQFYTYAVGPRGVPEWLHHTNNVNGLASMEIPNPRVLYNAFSSGAMFRYKGTTRAGGTTLYWLESVNPISIKPSIIGSLADSGHFTAFSVWINSNDVIQEIEFSTSARIGFTATASTRGWNLGPMATITTTSDVLVVFSELGVPQSVTAPSSSVDVQGGG